MILDNPKWVKNRENFRPLRTKPGIRKRKITNINKTEVLLEFIASPVVKEKSYSTHLQGLPKLGILDGMPAHNNKKMELQTLLKWEPQLRAGSDTP